MDIVEFWEKNIPGIKRSSIKKLEEVSIYKSYGKNEIILQEGESINSYMLMISKGVVRFFYHTPQGKEITECLVYKEWDTLMPSALFDQPSPTSIQALTDVDVIFWPFEAIDKLRNKVPEVVELEYKVLTAAWYEQWELRRIYFELDAKERYLWFLENYPGIFGTIPSKYIASFLNMSTVTLSRLRSELKQKNNT